jgi:hypothetical protein
MDNGHRVVFVNSKGNRYSVFQIEDMKASLPVSEFNVEIIFSAIFPCIPVVVTVGTTKEISSTPSIFHIPYHQLVGNDPFKSFFPFYLF